MNIYHDGREGTINSTLRYLVNVKFPLTWHTKNSSGDELLKGFEYLLKFFRWFQFFFFTMMVRSPSKMEEFEKLQNNYSQPIGPKLYMKYFMIYLQ